MGAQKTNKRKYNHPDDVLDIVNSFFRECDGIQATDENGKPLYTDKGLPVYKIQPKPYTINGLMLALNFTARDTINEYIARGKEQDATKEQKEISDILTRAKQKIENYAEQRLFDRDGCQGAKFWLVSNSKQWSDKQQIELQNTIKVTLLDD